VTGGDAQALHPRGVPSEILSPRGLKRRLAEPERALVTVVTVAPYAGILGNAAALLRLA
jgi:hypothetical protein